MTAPDYTWKSLLLPALWIIYTWSLEALATRVVVGLRAFLLCSPCEIALAVVPRQLPPGWGFLAGWFPVSVLRDSRRQDRELICAAA